MSVTLNWMVLLADSVVPSQLTAVPLALDVMSVQLLPPSTDPNRVSPATNPVLSVAVMVCAALRVMKSVLLPPLAPVSSLRAMELIPALGSVESST